MKQWNELYRDDIKRYLEENFLGKRVDSLWNQDICLTLGTLLPQEYRGKLTAYVSKGNSLYADIMYDGVTLFVVGITRSRELKDNRWSYQATAIFTYKEIEVYFTNDKMSFKDTIDAAIATKKQQAESRIEKLKLAKQVYDYMKEVLQTTSYTKLAEFLSFIKNNQLTISDMA